MDDPIRLTLVANAGVLLSWRGTTLLLDGIFGGEGHPFSYPARETLEAMRRGAPPFERLDYLLFTHAHPDHFSPELTLDFLRERAVKGVFLPQTRSVRESGLADFLRERRIPSVLLSSQTDHAAYRIEPELTVRAFTTLHLDEKYHHVHHFCYLLTLGEKTLLFTADVDYIHETLSQVRDVPLRAAFVNPLFFSDLRRRRFFRGELKAETICVYHVPFSGEDQMHIRPSLANDMVNFPAAQDVRVLSEPNGQLTL